MKFQLKIQGGSVPASEISVPKDATGSVLLDTIKNSLAAHEVGDMKVLCAGKRILGDTPVCSLRNSSPLLVLGVQAKAELQTAAKSPESRSPMAGSPQRVLFEKERNKRCVTVLFSGPEKRRRSSN